LPGGRALAEESRLETELRTAADALRRRSQQYRLLAEQAADGVLLVASDGRIADANPGACALLGRDRAALARLALADLVAADKAVDNVTALLGLERGQRLARAFRIRRPDDGTVEVEVSARRLEDGRLQLALRDLAERRRAAEALRESEERYERLAAAAPEAILVEASGRVVFSNPALRRLLALQPSAPIAGRVLAEFAHPEERAELARKIGEAAGAGPKGVPLALRLRRVDGSTAEVEGTASGVTYRGRPAVQIVLREIQEEGPVEAGDLYRDALTGLTSPLLVPDRLSVAIAQAYRYRARVGVVHVDLDGFARINSSLGRTVGDRILRSAARRLSNCVRQGDTAARLEADAFALLLPGLHHQEDATRIAEKVVRAMRKPFPVPERAVTITASVGVAVFPDDGDDAAPLLAAAEEASRRAREAGGDRCEASTPPAEAGYDVLELEAALRAALGRGQMSLEGAAPSPGVLHYQPVWSLATGRVAAVEALLRWQHPQLGLVFPRNFLSRADFTGLILAIGPWILRTATRQAREWQKRQRALRIAVNLSPPELTKRQTPDEVKAALEESGLAPRLLQIEVPEGHVMSDLPRSLETLQRFKALGVEVILDRFAIRYSSLGRLTELPVDGIKLDLSFLRGPTAHPEDVSLLTAVMAVARGLKLKVSAQGVETPPQLALLRRLGCTEAQGYQLGPPVPPAALVSQLGKRAAWATAPPEAEEA